MSDSMPFIIWIDHREAKIFNVTADHSDHAVISAHGTGRQLQHKGNASGSGHHAVDKEFFNRVIEALSASTAILVTGPANAKLELKSYIAEHRPDVDKRISGVEAIDHPSDGELVALGRKFFKVEDRIQPQAQ